MKDRVRVEVTQKDIEEGICENPNQCAIAKALQRFDRKVKVVWVDGSDDIRFDGGEWETTSVRDSGKVDRFIRRFDDGENVKPISFTMKRKVGDS